MYLGLDLSLTGTGVALVDEGGCRHFLVKSKPVGKKPVDELHRIETIVEDIWHGITDAEMEKIEMVAIEGLAFMARNTTALVQLSALNYFVRKMIDQEDKQFVIVAPTSLKKFVTGKGNAQKDQVMMEVFKRWGVSPEDSNVADAYGLAKMAEALYLGDKKLTREQRECLNLLREQL